MSHRLLILGCARRKKSLASCIPAVQRYDGPSFQVVRKFLRTHESARLLNIYILSAEFGLMSGQQPIADYDRVMTRQRALELRPAVLSSLATLVQQAAYTDILINLGSTYLLALEGYAALVPAGTHVALLRGSHGRRLADLYRWLYGNGPAEPDVVARPEAVQARLRGVVVSLSTDQVLEIGQQGLAVASSPLDHYQAWYVEIGHQRVSAKWLVSQVTGLPVKAFGAGEARRLLAQLGVEVKRGDELGGS